MNWRRFGQVLWVVGGVIAGICGMEWYGKASQDGWYIGDSYIPPPSPGIYPALTIVFGVVALVGIACILSAKDAKE